VNFRIKCTDGGDFEYDGGMSTLTVPIDNLILEQLGRGEKRLLTLVVAVRKSMGRFEGLKGDLSATVQSSLRKLVNQKSVIEVDGMYSLPPSK
jgi:hypothetical protein